MKLLLLVYKILCYIVCYEKKEKNYTNLEKLNIKNIDLQIIKHMKIILKKQGYYYKLKYVFNTTSIVSENKDNGALA